MDDVEILRRRLEREKLARREAEQLLESKSRQLYEAHEEMRGQFDELLRRNAKIQLLDSIVRSAQTGIDFNTTMQRFLDVVCQATGWPIGNIYVPVENDPNGYVLRPLKVWHMDRPEAFGTFRELTDKTLFKASVGLPGRVLATGKSAWIKDVHRDGNFPRAKQLPDSPIHSGFAVPIPVGDRTAAVAEFFSDQTFEMNDWLLDLVTTTAEQLGALLERRETEARLQRVNEELRRRTEEVEQFVFTVSHDLKSPLLTICGFADMLAQDIRAGRASEALVTIDPIKRAAEKMARLIEDLLHLSRIGRVLNVPQDVDVTDLVRQIGQELTAELGRVGATLDVQPEMPHLLIDRARLEQVFQNLVTNAIKYGCQGPAPRISIGAERRLGVVRYFVRDNGPGIPREYHHKIFGLFQRLHNDDRGTGVGLTIVSRIVQVHGGRCWVESEPGRGATFWCTFPAATLSTGPVTAPAGASIA